MGYSEEEITKTAIGIFNGAVFKRRKYIIPDTPPEYMTSNRHCLKHFDVPEDFLKVFKLEEAYHENFKDFEAAQVQ